MIVAVSFPKDFVWGAATAAYQIEGAAHADGRGESIWDRFSHTPGKTKHGDHGDVACDHYHRYAQDIAAMHELGVNAYRFSVSWPRVMPLGTGQVNARGLDFYQRLVDGLLEAGITPFLTLYHWDLPQALQERGGFASREIADWFGEYAGVIAHALGDRVKHFIPLNEPQVFSVLGNLTGEHAPGLQDFAVYGKVCHHVQLAHGAAVQALRAGANGLQVGTALQTPPMHPVTDSPEDRAAAFRFDGFFNRWYTDPVLLGTYPADTLEILEPLGVPIRDGDLARIHQPLDFVGLNHYTRMFVRAQPGPGLAAALAEDHRVPGAEYTAMGWEIYPQGLHELLTRFRTEYGNPPVYITENGGAFHDVVESGAVHDAGRVKLLRDYIASVERAMHDGANVKGYFVWSLLDNFEWAHGYDKRFGLIHVDYATGTRTPKDSARFYRDLIAGARQP